MFLSWCVCYIPRKSIPSLQQKLFYKFLKKLWSLLFVSPFLWAILGSKTFVGCITCCPCFSMILQFFNWMLKPILFSIKYIIMIAELGTIRSLSDQITIISWSWPELRSFFEQNLDMIVIGSSIIFWGIWSEKDREILDPFFLNVICHLVYVTQ